MTSQRQERPDWPDAFAEICDRHRARLVRWLTSLFGPRDAEDIAQETLARLYVRPDLLDPDVDAWPWLSVVARNVGRDVARRNAMSTAVAHDELEALPGGAAVFDQVAARADADLLARALRRLGTRDRALIRLRDVEGVSVADIAATMQTNENAVRQQLHRARRRLADAYLSLGGDRPLGLVTTIGMRLRELLYRSAAVTDPLAPASGPLLAALLPTIAVVTGGLLTGHASAGTGGAAEAGAGRTVATAGVAYSSSAADGARHASGTARGPRTAGSGAAGAVSRGGGDGTGVVTAVRSRVGTPFFVAKHHAGPASSDATIAKDPLAAEDGPGTTWAIFVELPIVGPAGTSGTAPRNPRRYGDVCRKAKRVCATAYETYDDLF